MRIITLFNAPAIIGNYIIKNKIIIEDIIDLMCTVVRMDNEEPTRYLFRGEMWKVVLKGVLNYIDVHNIYLDECLVIINNRRNGEVILADEFIEAYRQATR